MKIKIINYNLYSENKVLKPRESTLKKINIL